VENDSAFIRDLAPAAPRISGAAIAGCAAYGIPFKAAQFKNLSCCGELWLRPNFSSPEAISLGLRNGALLQRKGIPNGTEIQTSAIR
jgi:hypothetical protein